MSKKRKVFEGSFSEEEARQLAKEWSGLDQVEFVGTKVEDEEDEGEDKEEDYYNFEWVDDSFSLLCQLIKESTVSLSNTLLKFKILFLQTMQWIGSYFIPLL